MKFGALLASARFKYVWVGLERLSSELLALCCCFDFRLLMAVIRVSAVFSQYGWSMWSIGLGVVLGRVGLVVCLLVTGSARRDRQMMELFRRERSMSH